MILEFFLSNVLMDIVTWAIPFLVIALVAGFAFKNLRLSLGAWFVALVVMSSLYVIATVNRPKVKLTSQSSGASYSQDVGEIESNRPDRMTDVERLEYNQRLYNANKRYIEEKK